MLGWPCFQRPVLRLSHQVGMYADLRVSCAIASLCWYDTMRTSAASWSSSVASRSLVMASTFAFSGISARMVGISISVGMMASIPYVRANDDMSVGFRLVIL